MNTTRYVYNKTVQAIRDGHKINKYDLRDKLVTALNNNLPEWELKTPRDVREGAVRDVTSAYKICFTQLRNGTISKFNVGFREKKQEQSIVIPKSAIKIKDKKLYIYPDYIPDSLLTIKNLNINDINYDCRLLYYRYDFYLLVPITIQKHNTEAKKEFVSGDLGNRTFLTTFSNTEVIQFKRDKNLLDKLHKKMDSLKSVHNWKKSVSERDGIGNGHKFKKAMTKVEQKIDNIVNDLHWKTISYLTDNYQTILLGRLESQKCVKKNKNHYTNRMTNTLKHYKFIERIRYKCSSKGCNLLLVNEAYTSQTCYKCGNLTKTKLEIYKCNYCGLTVNRDVLGARNIAVKALVS